MGPLTSHMADLDSAVGCIQSGHEVLVRFASQFPGPVNPQANHVGGLSGRVVNRLGEFDPFPSQLSLPCHRSAAT